jgi:hypothetical protein
MRMVDLLSCCLQTVVIKQNVIGLPASELDAAIQERWT